MTSGFDAIERLIAEDRRRRGIAGLVQWGHLEGAARSLSGATRVAVISGFYLLEPGAGETDGPPGAKAVGEALAALGSAVDYVTDPPNAPLFANMGLDAHLYHPQWLEQHAPSHLLAIERPGRAADGRYYSMGGEDISAYTDPIDQMFLDAPGQGVQTLAIGDGGNEIGMGNVADQVRREVPHGQRIACVVPAGQLVVCGISNFGAYGLAAALSLMSGRMLLPSDGEAARSVLDCVAAGACCGHTFRNEALVDGTDLQETHAVLKRLREILRGAGVSG